MKKLAYICLVCIGLVLVALILISCTDMSAEEIVKKMQKKYDAVEDYKGTMVVKTNFQGEVETYEVHFMMKKPSNKYKSEDENLLFVSNGKTTWIYNKKKNVVTKLEIAEERREMPEFDYGEIIKDSFEKSDIKLIGKEKVSGRECYVIEVTPENNTFYVKQKLWIDKEFWYPLEIKVDYGEFNSTIEYRNVEFNTGINDEEFEFETFGGQKWK
ncbi:MAG: outer membrane lipoprotein carrier protein LolA [archaeon]|nr:outer membrane lipoprotein carrier protein LolA [archaeon]